MKTFKIKSTYRHDAHGEELFLVETYFGEHYYGDNIWTRREIMQRKSWDNVELIWLDNAVKEESQNYDDDDNIF